MELTYFPSPGWISLHHYTSLAHWIIHTHIQRVTHSLYEPSTDLQKIHFSCRKSEGKEGFQHVCGQEVRGWRSPSMQKHTQTHTQAKIGHPLQCSQKKIHLLCCGMWGEKMRGYSTETKRVWMTLDEPVAPLLCLWQFNKLDWRSLCLPRLSVALICQIREKAVKCKVILSYIVEMCLYKML